MFKFTQDKSVEFVSGDTLRRTAATGGKTGEKPYEVIGMNGFAVVLGEVQVVLPVVGRFRATRRDAVYNAPPLLEFSGRRDRPWKVYPPR